MDVKSNLFKYMLCIIELRRIRNFEHIGNNDEVKIMLSMILINLKTSVAAFAMNAHCAPPGSTFFERITNWMKLMS